MSRSDVDMNTTVAAAAGSVLATTPANNGNGNGNGNSNGKVSADQIASFLLKQNFILTALEFHTELAENGRELPRLRDYFSK